MVTTSTSWDVTPTTHGDVVIWPTLETWPLVEHGSSHWVHVNTKNKRKPIPISEKWCMKNGTIQPTYEKNPGGSPNPSNPCIEICISCWKQCRVFMKILGVPMIIIIMMMMRRRTTRIRIRIRRKKNYGICPCLFHTLILTSQPSQPSLVARLWPLPVRSEVGRHGLEI